MFSDPVSGSLDDSVEKDGTFYITKDETYMEPVMGTHSFIRYIVTVTVTSLVTTVTNEHLQ
jgi:hypothetical protein